MKCTNKIVKNIKQNLFGGIITPDKIDFVYNINELQLRKRLTIISMSTLDRYYRIACP